MFLTASLAWKKIMCFRKWKCWRDVKCHYVSLHSREEHMGVFCSMLARATGNLRIRCSYTQMWRMLDRLLFRSFFFSTALHFAGVHNINIKVVIIQANFKPPLLLLSWLTVSLFSVEQLHIVTTMGRCEQDNIQQCMRTLTTLYTALMWLLKVFIVFLRSVSI